MMGEQAKAEIDNNSDQAANNAAEYMTQLHSRDHSLHLIESQLTEHLDTSSDCYELSELLHSKAAVADSAFSTDVGEFTAKKKSIVFDGMRLGIKWWSATTVVLS